MKIGIFSGTFDPFHMGHYEIVNKVLDDNLVDKVVVLPTVVKYYRTEKFLFENADREKIIRKWFDGRTDVILDFSEYRYFDLDISRRYYHMLLDAIGRYGKENEYVTIVGGDSWNSLKSWYEWENLFTHSDFIVVKRDEDNIIDHYIEYTDQCWTCPKTVVEIDKKFGDVSATKIREHLRDIISGMSMGPSATCLEQYLEEIEDYLKTGKTCEEKDREYRKTEEIIDNIVGRYFDNKEYDKNRLNSDKTIIAHTPIFDVCYGKEVERGFKPVQIESKDWVTIIVECNGKFLMERQLRHGLNKEFEEFPCGMIECGEVPYEAAMRELKEETGLEFNTFTLRYLGKYSANPAFMTNYMHFFHLKLDDYKNGKTKFDEHEHIKSYWKNKNEAFEDFLKSEGSSIMGCAWMLLMRNNMLT